jgi:predicted PurR-regulated permease PerM
LLVYISLQLLLELHRLLVWLFVSVFIAAVMSPLVALLTRRGIRRGVAVAIVVLTVLLVASAGTYAFVQPLVAESTEFAEDLPELVDDVQDTPLVRQFLERFDIENRLEETSADLPQRLMGFTGPLVDAFKTVGEFVIAVVTIFVLTIFLLLYGPGFVKDGIALVRDRRRREYIQDVGRDVLSAVSGWVAGNLLTSLIAIVVSLIVFLIFDLPYSVLLSLWVGVADLIPLVGATLGALPAIGVAFTQSVPVGLAITAYFIIYQQLENHVLQPYVYGRTIQLNPFIVLVAVLAGVELAGFLGALFALPVAGAIQVVLARVISERLHPEEEPKTLETPQT